MKLIERIKTKPGYLILAVAIAGICLLTTLIGSFDLVQDDKLQDQPTKKEKILKAQQEKDEAAALALFCIK